MNERCHTKRTGTFLQNRPVVEWWTLRSAPTTHHYKQRSPHPEGYPHPRTETTGNHVITWHRLTRTSPLGTMKPLSALARPPGGTRQQGWVELQPVDFICFQSPLVLL